MIRITNELLRIISQQEDSNQSGDSQDSSNEEGDASQDSSSQDNEDQDGSNGSNGSQDGEEEGQESSSSKSNGSEEEEGQESGSSNADGSDEGSDEGSEGQKESESQDSGDNTSEGGASTLMQDIQQMSGDEFQEMLKQLQNELKDSNEALTNLVNSQFEGELKTTQFGSVTEQHYRPYTTVEDRVVKVEDGGPRTTKKLKDAAKPLCGALKAKLRTKFLMARKPETLHGTKNGELSSRRLVSSMVQIKSGKMPSRPNQTTIEANQTTLAVSIVLDESSSMTKRLIVGEATASLAIAQALESVDCPVEVIGFRDGHADFYVPEGLENYHRTGSVNIDVFKGYEEKVAHCAGRFTNVVACGGTPMADGIHHAMVGMSNRTETHRVILVLTDGYPNNSKVVTRQIRLAKEAGVSIIGVGLEYGGCAGVTAVFPDNNILVNDINDLPKALMSCLEGIMFPKKSKKIRLDT